MASERARCAGPGQALLLTAASAAIPGLAHLCAGRRRAGTVLLAAYAGLLAAGSAAFLGQRDRLVQVAVRPDQLTEVMVGALALAVGWSIMLMSSFRSVRPAGMSGRTSTWAWLVVLALCAGAAAPPLAVARYSYVQRDLLGTLFSSAPAKADSPAEASVQRPAGAGLPARLNVLLIGGDADVHRPGVRTDSMTLASVDTRTGDTVLVSLPRNLQHVPVWNGRARVAFPAAGLLNAVYQHGLAHPALAGGRNPGAQLLKRTFARIVGQPVDYYAMVDMRSFRQIVDATDGVRICVPEAVQAPRRQVPAGVIKPGCRVLSGREALWYGRSRTGSSDYARMSRQKCLMWAMARQADPLTVLRNFQRLAKIFKYSVSTDLPQDLLPGLVELRPKISSGGLRSVQFVPPVIDTWRPDYTRIRTVTAGALRAPVPPRPVRDLAETCG